MFQKLFRRTPPAPPPATPLQNSDVSEIDNNLAEIDKQIKRLAKELYKTNTLAESQSEQTRQAMELMKAALGELQAVQKSSQETVQSGRVEVAKALFPVIDSIEAGINSGAEVLNSLADISAEAKNALGGWLDGQRLLLDRLDTIVQNEGIQRINTVGTAFDPHYHVAVKSVSDLTQNEGVIVKEERRGYVRGNSILRYAEVVVNRNGSRP